MNLGASSLLIATLLISFGAGCSTSRNAVNEPRPSRERWFAHCDTCNWCKGSFKTTQDVQEVVTRHNKTLHDWFKVAYYDQVKCP
jgi:hypothetical protein